MTGAAIENVINRGYNQLNVNTINMWRSEETSSKAKWLIRKRESSIMKWQ
jgi:hypothetical protein